MNQILIVEDDRILNQTLTFNLVSEGYRVDSAYSCREAREMQGDYGVILLDVNLPDGSGLALCEEFKAKTPRQHIIFLTANDRESDMLRGYEAGGTDYVTKPFSVAVLCRKVGAVFANLRQGPREDCFDDGWLHLDFARQRATLGDAPLELTPKEYRTLHLFVQNGKMILTKGKLLQELWDVDGEFVDEHTLTTIISRIRKKLERDGHKYIKTIYGVGYQWIGGDGRDG